MLLSGSQTICQKSKFLIENCWISIFFVGPAFVHEITATGFPQFEQKISRMVDLIFIAWPHLSAWLQVVVVDLNGTQVVVDTNRQGRRSWWCRIARVQGAIFKCHNRPRHLSYKFSVIIIKRVVLYDTSRSIPKTRWTLAQRLQDCILKFDLQNVDFILAIINWYTYLGLGIATTTRVGSRPQTSYFTTQIRIRFVST